MSRSAVPLDTIWPNGSDPKTLVCVRAQCSVADLFDTVFGEADVLELLHKQRGDNDLIESPWVATKEELPVEMYTWQAPGPPNKPSITLRHRKVRFESPPTALASKPFQNEESQVITELYPDYLYLVEAVSTTSAPYGDKFNIYFRYMFRTDESSPTSAPSSALHLLFHVEWLPSMNRMMRPVVGKAVDSGVRGTFKIFRTALATKRTIIDIRESELPQGEPPAMKALESVTEPVAQVPVGLGAKEAPGSGLHPPTAAYPHPSPAPGAGFAPGVGPPPNLVTAITQQLVYKDQVVLLADLLGVGLRSVSSSDLGAQLLAATLTVWLINLAVTALVAWQTMCGGEHLDGSILMRAVRMAVCWPLALVKLPHSTAEVLMSLALVAAINWAVIRSTESMARYVNRRHPGLLAASRSAPGSGGDVFGGVAFSQTPVLGMRASGGGAQAGGAGWGPSGNGGVPGGPGGGGGGGPNRAQSASTSISRATSISLTSNPVVGSGTSAVGVSVGSDKEERKSASDVGGGGSTSFFAAAAAAVGAASKGVAAATGGSTAVKARAVRAAPAPKQFTPAQMRQLELGHVNSPKNPPTATHQTAPSVPPLAPANSPVLATAAMADAWAADLPAGMIVPSDAKGSSPPPSSPPPRPASPLRKRAETTAPPLPPPPPPPPSVEAPSARSATAVVEHALTKPVEAAADSSHDGGISAPAPTMYPSPGFSSTSSSTPTSALAATSAATAPAPGASSFVNMFTKEGFDSMTEGIRSAFRWDVPKTSDQWDFPIGSPEASSPSTAFPQQHQLTKLKPRSDIGAGSTTSTATGKRSAGGAAAHSHTAMSSLLSVQSDIPLLAAHREDEHAYAVYGGGGDDEYDSELEPALVVEEVFENERFQPFRGWGHMWPGHFLPSDRVGHWSDRQGKPGGTASMVFEQVVPQLTGDWKWLEDDWQVDLEGLEEDAVDTEGWTYAMDFYLLKYPPPQQGGKCSLKHFVRRRRYFRTRVRIETVRRSTRSPGDLADLTGYSPRGSDAITAEDDVWRAAIDTSTAANPIIATTSTITAAAVPSGGDVGDAGGGLVREDRLMSLSEAFPGAVVETQEVPHTAVGGGRASSSGSNRGGVEVDLRPTATAGGLPRPSLEAEGLLEVLRQKEPQRWGLEEEVGRSGRPSLSGPAGGGAATAAALSVAQVQTTRPLLPTGIGAVSQSDCGADGSAGGGGGGGADVVLIPHPAADVFVGSPKMEVKSHDPLGALTAPVLPPSLPRPLDIGGTAAAVAKPVTALPDTATAAATKATAAAAAAASHASTAGEVVIVPVAASSEAGHDGGDLKVGQEGRRIANFPLVSAAADADANAHTDVAKPGTVLLSAVATTVREPFAGGAMESASAAAAQAPAAADASDFGSGSGDTATATTYMQCSNVRMTNAALSSAKSGTSSPPVAPLAGGRADVEAAAAEGRPLAAIPQ